MRYVLIDAGHLVGRVSATNVVDLRTSDGLATGITHGVLRALSYVKNTMHVGFDQIICCWDYGRSQWRLDLYPEYKANRTKEDTPESLQRYEDYKAQKKDIQYLLGCLGSRQLQVYGVECDDLIGILSTQLMQDRNEVVIYSGDHDMHQLASDTVKIWNPRDDEPEDLRQILFNYDLDSVDQLLLLKAITGDSSDNISGIKGIGPKRAGLVVPHLYKTSEGWKSSLIQSDSQAWKYTQLTLKNIDIVERNLKLITIPRTLEASNFTEEQKLKISAELSCEVQKNPIKFMERLRLLELQTIIEQSHLYF